MNSFKGFLIGILLTTLSFTGCSSSKGDIYILPKNYVGTVVIIHNQNSSYEPYEINGRKVFTIPNTGTLKTVVSPNYNWKGSDEVYYDNYENGRNIPVVRDQSNYKVDKVNATLISTGTTRDSLGNEIEFSVFHVGTRDQISSFADSFRKRTEW